MMQSPLLGYTAFSHFLQRHHQSSAMSSPPTLGLPPGAPGEPGPRGAVGALSLPGMPPGAMGSQFLASSLLQHLHHPQLPQLSAGLTTRCPSPSPGSSVTASPHGSPRASPRPSPRPSPGCTPPTHLPAGHGVKSFTIDAILGLGGRPTAGGHTEYLRPHHYLETSPSPTDLSTGGRPQQPLHRPRRPSSGQYLIISYQHEETK